MHRTVKAGTRLGGHFDYAQPEAYEPDLREIAFALSSLARFNGHTRFYVAQHSVLLSRVVPQDYAFMALMRDAHKAYMGEIGGPLKAMLPDYRSLEKRVAASIRNHFGVRPVMPDIVEKINDALTLTEAIRFGIPARDFPAALKPLPLRIDVLNPEDALRAYVQRYRELAPAATGLQHSQSVAA
jgi:hypothetical protein